MHTLVPCHVVTLSGISVEVGLCAGLGAGIQELQRVLGNADRVVHADDNLQFALQILGLVDAAGLFVALGVLLRCVHVALAIHYLVPLPVYDRATGNTYLKDVGVGCHQRCCHKAAEAPSVNAQSVGIHIGEALQVLNAAHLVLHLNLTQVAEGGLFEVTTAVLAASVVYAEDNVALLCHVGIPATAAPVP